MTIAAPSQATDRWFQRHARPEPPALQLFCLPFAGGSATIYRGWPALLPPHIEVQAAQLPGRAVRLKEPPVDEFGRLADTLAAAVLAAADRPYALYGHSMGALLAFEVARRAEAAGRPCELLAVGAHPAPHLPRRVRPISDLPDAEFIEALRTMSGTPEAVLRAADLMRLLLPALRADFRVCETYAYRPAPPLTSPILALGGLDDVLAGPDDVEAWARHSTAGVDVRIVDGGHFFVATHAPLVVDLVATALKDAADR